MAPRMPKLNTLIETPIGNPILGHISTFFGKCAISCHRWPLPPKRPMPESWNSLFVAEVRKARKFPGQIVYLTSGAWRLTSGEPRLEFMMCAWKPSIAYVRILTMLASFHQDPDFPLDVGHRIEIGWPWLPGSTCDRLLLSLPYPFGPDLEWLKWGDVPIRFLWALPITARESEFAGSHSVEELEQLFDEVKLSYLDPYRKSVI